MEYELEKGFRPPWWLRNAHVQSILPSLAPRRALVQWRSAQVRERSRPVILECGDEVRLLALHTPAITPNPRGAIVMLHGWEGDAPLCLRPRCEHAKRAHLLAQGRATYGGRPLAHVRREARLRHAIEAFEESKEASHVRFDRRRGLRRVSRGVVREPCGHGRDEIFVDGARRALAGDYAAVDLRSDFRSRASISLTRAPFDGPAFVLEPYEVDVTAFGESKRPARGMPAHASKSARRQRRRPPMATTVKDGSTTRRKSVSPMLR